MPVFNYSVQAIANSDGNPCVYCVAVNHNETMEASFSEDLSFPVLIPKSDKASCFQSYVFFHLSEIISGKDKQAELRSVMVQNDFSLTILINPTSVCSLDGKELFELEVKNPKDKCSSIDVSVFSKESVLREQCHFFMAEGSLLINEYDINLPGRVTDNPPKRVLILKKSNWPNITVSDS